MKKNDLFKQRLRSVMEINQITKKDLVKELNVVDSTITRYCNGSSTPSDDNLNKLCTLFNVDKNWLLGYDTSINGEQELLDETQQLYKEYKDKLTDEDKQYINYIVKQSIKRIDRKLKEEK